MASKKAGTSHLPRYGIIFGTAPSSEEIPPENVVESVLNQVNDLKWDRVWNRTVPPSWSDPEITGFDGISWQNDPLKLSEAIHSLLDLLPDFGPSKYHLDIVWVVWGLVPEKILTPLLYGSLRKAVEWHNSSLTVVTSAQLLKTWKLCDSLKSDVNARWNAIEENVEFPKFPLQDSMVWRGRMELLADHDRGMEFLSGQFELLSKDHNSFRNWILLESTPKDGILLSRNLTIMSRCNLRSVPTYLLTDIRFELRPFPDLEDKLTKHILTSNDVFGEERGVVAKLSYCVDNSGFTKPKLALDDWKKYVINSNSDERSRCSLMADDEVRLEYVYLLIFRDCEGKLLAIVLDPENPGRSKASWHHKVQVAEDVPGEDGVPRIALSCPVNLSKIQSVISKIQSEVLKMLMNTDPESNLLKANQIETTLKLIQSRVLSKIQNLLSVHQEIPEDEEPIEDVFADLDGDWEEKRFLNHIENLNLKKKNVGMMQPSAGKDFMVLDAKEILSLFNSEGLARFPEDQETLMRKNKGRSLDINEEKDVESRLKKGQVDWPEVGEIKYHDLYYNLAEDSEELDAERMKVQRMYLGVNETGSTCNSNEQTKPIIVRKKEKPKEEPNNTLRRSPRKKPAPPMKRSASGGASVKSGTSSRTDATKSTAAKGRPDEVYRKKLRFAVYEALGKQGIDDKNHLFRPCFKRLFEITKMYAKDSPKTGTMSTSQWLQNVAQQNAHIVVNLEKSISATSK